MNIVYFIFDLKVIYRKLLADFILTCTPNAKIGDGLIRGSNGTIACSLDDTSDVLELSRIEIAPRIFQMPGPADVLREYGDEAAEGQKGAKLVVEMKFIFESFSTIVYQTDMKCLGSPTFFFDPSFAKHMRLDDTGNIIAVISQWVRNQGRYATSTFCIQRSQIPDLLSGGTNLVRGTDELTGSAFLGLLFEFEPAVQGLGMAVNHGEKCFFTVFYDPEATLDQLSLMKILLGIVNNTPLDVNDRFFGDGMIDEEEQVPLPTTWFVKLNSDGIEYQRPFTQFYALEHFMHWIRPEMWTSISLFSSEEFIEGRQEGATISLACPDSFLLEMLFVPEVYAKVRGPNGILSMIHKISFHKDPKTEGLTLICYHVLPDKDVYELKEALKTRIQAHLLKDLHGLGRQAAPLLDISIDGHVTRITKYFDLAAAFTYWPEALKDDTHLSVTSSLRPLSRKGSLNAYQVIFEPTMLREFFLRAFQILTGSFGGFWKNNFRAYYMRPCKTGKKGRHPHNFDGMWEFIWVVDEAGGVSQEEHMMVLAKLLIICKQHSPLYAAGRFTPRSALFESQRAFNGITDEYEAGVEEMLMIVLPNWLIEKEKREKLGRELELAVKRSQLADILCQEAEERVEKRKKIQLALIQAHIRTENTRLHISNIDLIMARFQHETASTSFRAAQLQVREEELRFANQEKALKKILAKEQEAEKKLAKIHQQEAMLQEKIDAMHQARLREEVERETARREEAEREELERLRLMEEERERLRLMEEERRIQDVLEQEEENLAKLHAIEHSQAYSHLNSSSCVIISSNASSNSEWNSTRRRIPRGTLKSFFF